MQAFLLFALGLLLVPENVHSNSNLQKRGINLPSDGGTLADGINEYPPRVNINPPSKENSSASSNEDGELSYKCGYSSNDAKLLLNTVKKVVLTFYSENYEKINMRSDAAIGLNMIAHKMVSIMEEKNSNMSAPFIAFLSEIMQAARMLAPKIVDQANAAIPDPSRKFGAEVMRNFTSSPNMTGYNGRKVWKSMEAIEEHFGEFSKIGQEKEVIYPYLDLHCMVTLIESCSVPHVCQKMYLEEPYSQYMLTHQARYVILGKFRGCFINENNIQEHSNRLCSKAYLEAQFLEKNNFPTKFLDLFAEQVGICGGLGYESFMRADWLREIISWLSGSESGCALNVYGEKKTTDAKVFVTTKNGEQESCLVHLTSVSLGALALNLRYMFDTCSMDIFNEFVSTIS